MTSPRSATVLLVFDDYARYTGLILAATVAASLLSFGYSRVPTRAAR